VTPPSSTAGRRLALAGLAIVAAGLAAWQWLGPYKGYDAESVVIEIPRGEGPSVVASRLQQAGVIRSAWVFRAVTRLRGHAGSLQAGEYEFEGPLSPAEVIDALVRGEVLLHKLTIPEGLSGPEVIDRVVAMDLAPAAGLESAFRDTSPLAGLDDEARNLEGYLFPETYRFARGTPARRVLGEMVARFKREFGPALRARAKAMGMSLREVVTLASLIEKETSVPEERSRISAVFHNRLRLGMALQCDPTVIFALASAGLYDGSLTREDLAYDSPYNTYLNPGLPPGPIASPGAASLRAAGEPAETSDLYFVADGTGGHTFSTSLEDHLRAVARYRRLRKSGV